MIVLCTIDAFAGEHINLMQRQSTYKVLKMRPVFVAYKNPNVKAGEQVGWLNDGSYIIELYGEDEVPGWTNIRFAYVSRSTQCTFSKKAKPELKNKIEKTFTELIKSRGIEVKEIKEQIRTILKNENINPDCFNMNEGYIKTRFLLEASITKVGLQGVWG